MKINELIGLADEYLSVENRKLKSKIKCLKHVLKKLSKREKKLEKKFAEIQNNDGKGNKEKISNELAMIHAHRKKGLDLLKKLQEQRKEKGKSVDKTDKKESNAKKD